MPAPTTDQDTITQRRRRAVKTAIALAMAALAVFVGYIALVIFSASGN